MINDLVLALTALGSPARLDGDNIIVHGETIKATLTGRIIASNNNERITLGTCQDSADHIAQNFVNHFR